MNRFIEIKKWSEYSSSEKKELLLHWWFYYGKDVINLSEMEAYMELLEDCADEIFKVALTSFKENNSPRTLLLALRQDNLQNLFAASEEKFSKELETIQEEFINMLAHTYNDPKPPVPMSDDEIMDQIRKTTGVKKFTMIKLPFNLF